MADNCTSANLPFPSVFGAHILSVEAAAVQNYTYFSPIWKSAANHGQIPTTPATFCNVTVTHTHPGKNDTLNTQIWLPFESSWNSRLQMAGGGGWVAGLDELALGMMFTAVSEGYVTSGVDGGVSTLDPYSPKAWALTSPGNVDYNLLQDFAVTGLHDGALITKSITESFYGRPANYSYWSGCSQGGRQGHMFAQRYPEIFDGIAAAAPAINWAQLFTSQLYPQQVLNEMAEYPQPCEYDTLTEAAIDACDRIDGLTDGIISHPDSCSFDPYQLVGTLSKCGASSEPKLISKAAATAMDAAWHGTRALDGSLLWPSVGYEANVTTGVLPTVCSGNDTCKPQEPTLFTHFLQYFVERDPEFDIKSMTRQDFVRVFKKGVREYSSVLGTDSADLSEFRSAGGKMLTYHGLADPLIPFRNSRHYYDRVALLDPNVHDFYRLFEAPGLEHCIGGPGGQPTEAFNALVDWVERGIVPESLVGKNPANQTNLLCPYPKKAVYKSQGQRSIGPTAGDFVCQ